MKERIFFKDKRQSKTSIRLSTGNLKRNIKIKFITHRPVLRFFVQSTYVIDGVLILF